ncbi:MAG: hypothetical protein K2K29_06905, partial [Muribaculaceae bacterium]|nr:hypothetical protein [Muribaculaceae bacterium]
PGMTTSKKRKRNGSNSAIDSADVKKTASQIKNKSGHLASVWIREMRYGEAVPVDFFTQNAWILVIFLVAILSLIGLRYKTKTKMEEIKSLTHKLELVESAKLQEKAEYMSLIRETEMRRLVTEKNLGLIFQEQPPYEIELSNN